MEWVVMFGCLFVSFELLKAAIELPTLRGAGAAQSDFGLFMAAPLFGVPAALIGMAVAVVGWALDRKLPKTRFPSCQALLVIGILNIFVAPGVMVWTFVYR